MVDNGPREFEGQDVEVDAETSAAIERGIQAADAGRVVSENEVAAVIQRWISKSSTPSQR